MNGLRVREARRAGVLTSAAAFAVAVVVVGAVVVKDHVRESLERPDSPCALVAPTVGSPLARRDSRVEVRGPGLQDAPAGMFCVAELPPDAHGYARIAFVDGRQWIAGPFEVARNGTYDAYVDVPPWAPTGRAVVVFGSGSFEGKLGRLGSADSWSPGKELLIGG